MTAGLFASGSCNPCETTTAGTSGIIASDMLPATLVSPTFTLPVGVPFPFFLELEVSAFAGYVFGGSTCVGAICSSAFNIDSLSDFSHTLSLPLSGPVLNLPDGFTLDSLQANIVGNRVVAPAALPVSGTLALFMPGLLVLPLFTKPRRRTA